MRYYLIVSVISFVCIGFANASTIYLHNGNVNPELEGWAVEPTFATGGRPVSGPITNDIGTGLDAWSIDDDLSTIGSNWFYTNNPSTLNHNNASSRGWTLRANLRLIDLSDDVSNAGAVMLEYANGVIDYRLALGTEIDGDPIALLWDGGTVNGIATGEFFTLEGGGSGYHLYELIYNPVGDAVSLWIDGIERLSNYQGHETDLFNRVAWGAGSSFDTGHAHWNSVEWEISAVPLPASVLLLFSGLLGLGWVGKPRLK